MDVVDRLATAARVALARSGDQAKAPAMQAYMKSALPFRGVPKPVRSRLTRHLFAEFVLPDRGSFVAAVEKLWREAAFREERYIAIDLTGYRPYARWQDSALLPLYDELIVTGAWWDYVDDIAVHRIGPLLRAEPRAVGAVLHRWVTDPDRWRRRTAVICQLDAKTETDLDLLTHAIEANIDERDFFLRKGIGWALRQYARTDPAWVRGFVADHPGLSALSVREALKHLR
ncbi:DNA alkylation repair protein [Amycolatopsis rhizosphaerae]|uniref:DNA alkylation repair protein n=1 Tax=Amycolatopsis rhizosphaerae TaxID=2053003 RepID=A0A558AET3_9PSEU|nr:DNA alkylation repair protein [Amycolatopsis rhizosphaerae]TVT22761.1 DNA alkylation repair protein [Amycolatopsis rhizosphaerae]